MHSAGSARSLLAYPNTSRVPGGLLTLSADEVPARCLEQLCVEVEILNKHRIGAHMISSPTPRAKSALHFARHGIAQNLSECARTLYPLKHTPKPPPGA